MSSDEEYDYEYSDDEGGSTFDKDDNNLIEWNPIESRDSPTCTISSWKQKTTISMLPAEELVPEMKRRLTDVMEILDVPEPAASALLREHEWSKEALLEDYYNNSEALLKKCGVYHRCYPVTAGQLTTQPLSMVEETKAERDSSVGNPKEGFFFFRKKQRRGGDADKNNIGESLSSRQEEERHETLSNTRTSQNCNSINKPKDCGICLERMEEENEETMAMPCGHEFCLDCWHDFCVNAIQEEGGTCIHAKCPQSGCFEILTEQEVQVVAPELLSKFQGFQLRSFVESNALTRWCPGQGCEKVACAERAMDESVAHCNACYTSFCIVCGEEPHDPCKCKTLSLWTVKCSSESENATYLMANTKTCPKCGTRIEKNGGCQYITCTTCSHGFCWICMGDHHVWKCNQYDESSADADRAKSELERYLHYYQRYHGHAEAQNFASEQLEIAEAKDMASGSSDEFSWKYIRFLNAANKRLVECRRVLKYTYVFAYYHFADPSMKKKQECFEHHQGLLESLTEGLSKVTEKPLEEIDQKEVVNQTSVIEQFIKNVVEYVENGMDDD